MVSKKGCIVILAAVCYVITAFNFSRASEDDCPYTWEHKSWTVMRCATRRTDVRIFLRPKFIVNIQSLAQWSIPLFHKGENQTLNQHTIQDENPHFSNATYNAQHTAVLWFLIKRNNNDQSNSQAQLQYTAFMERHRKLSSHWSKDIITRGDFVQAFLRGRFLREGFLWTAWVYGQARA